MPLIAKHEPDERRSKVDQMTGETRSKQPAWTKENDEDFGVLYRLAVEHRQQDALMNHWRSHKYSDPVDTIQLARELLADLGITVPPGTSEE
jgi:hypothetical protein